MIDLNQVMTFSEAAEKWGLANGNTLRKAVERKRFHEDEIRKSGDVWLTTYQAMQRVFGQPKQTHQVLALETLAEVISKSFYQNKDAKKELEKILHQLTQTIDKQKTVTIITSPEQDKHIVMVIKNHNDLDAFMKTLTRYLKSVSINIK